MKCSLLWKRSHFSVPVQGIFLKIHTRETCLPDYQPFFLPAHMPTCLPMSGASCPPHRCARLQAQQPSALSPSCQPTSRPPSRLFAFFLPPSLPVCLLNACLPVSLPASHLPVCLRGLSARKFTPNIE